MLSESRGSSTRPFKKRKYAHPAVNTAIAESDDVASNANDVFEVHRKRSIGCAVQETNWRHRP